MIASDVEIKPASLEDVLAFNGAPSGKTIKAFSIFWRGELVAISGVTIEPDKMVFFSDVKDDIDPPKLSIWRVSKYIVARIKEMGVPVVASPDPDKQNSEEYLTRLGFSYIGDSAGNKIYRL